MITKLLLILLPLAFINQGNKIYIRDVLSHQPIIICNSLSDSIITYQKNNGKKVQATLSFQKSEQVTERSGYSQTTFVQYEGTPEDFSLLLDKIAVSHGWEDSIGSRPFVIILFDRKLRIREVHVVSPFMYDDDVQKIATIVHETEGHWLYVKKSRKHFNAVVFIKRFS